MNLEIQVSTIIVRGDWEEKWLVPESEVFWDGIVLEQADGKGDFKEVNVRANKEGWRTEKKGREIVVYEEVDA
jgi:hypothetical protein